MTITPTTCQFHRAPGLVTMRLDDGVTVLLTEAMAAALWQALGAAIAAEPMPSHGDEGDEGSGGQGGGR